MNRFAFATLLLVFTPLPAQGGTLTTFVKVNTGLFDDPALLGFSTWAMRITADTDWTNSKLGIELSSGTMNHFLKPGSFLDPDAPTAEPTGAVLGDTAVFDPLTSLGDFSGGLPGTTAVPSSLTETSTDYEVSWFNVATSDTGTFDVAMITISDDANGELRFLTVSGSLIEDGGIISGTPIFSITNGCIQVNLESCLPEPSSLLLAFLGMMSALGRRRPAPGKGVRYRFGVYT